MSKARYSRVTVAHDIDISAFVGTAGGILGAWAAYLTIWRDRATIRVTLERRYAPAHILKTEVQEIVPQEEQKDHTRRDYAVIIVRNLGNRQAALEKVVEYYENSSGPGFVVMHRALDIILGEQKRRYSYAIDMTDAAFRLFAVGVRDDRGRTHFCFPGRGFVKSSAARARLRKFNARLASTVELHAPELDTEDVRPRQRRV